MDAPELGVELASALHNAAPQDSTLAGMNQLLVNQAVLRGLQGRERIRSASPTIGAREWTSYAGEEEISDLLSRRMPLLSHPLGPASSRSGCAPSPFRWNLATPSWISGPRVKRTVANPSAPPLAARYPPLSPPAIAPMPAPGMAVPTTVPASLPLLLRPESFLLCP